MTNLLDVRDLVVEFVDRGSVVNTPLRGISLSIAPGEILGIVGETGCGKSLTGLAVLGLLPSGARLRGQIFVDGVQRNLEDPGNESIRGRIISLVFQNPGTAFNPVFTLGSQMLDVLNRHERIGRKAAQAKILRQLELVRLPDPERVFGSYPHELSGGMLQRVMIAMALLCQPRLLILDEPTTALDVTVAQQILALILELRDSFDFGVMLITHNLGVVRDVCDRVAVLYAGRVVEMGPTEIVLESSRHPYTRGLLGALPSRESLGHPLIAIPGSVPSNLLAITGCSFANRCAYAIDECRSVDPRLEPEGFQHYTACLRRGDL
jgi:peptide/nickel transport system ATP-binding protein